MKYTGDDNNPPPKKHLGKIKSIYFLILDSQNQPQHFQCLTKKLWIDEMLQDLSVDGIEFYSLNHWINNACNLSSITVNAKKISMQNPQTFLLYRSLHLFMQRSSAEYLCIIGDASFIRVKPFLNFFHEVTRNIDGRKSLWATGNCIEERYFFKMNSLDSGIIISRKTVEELLKKKDMWNITIELAHPPGEAFAQILDAVGVSVMSTDNSFFLGRQWEKIQDFSEMIKGNYNNIPICEIPAENLISRPGLISNCNKKVTQLKKVLSWAGGGNNNKTEFLENVKHVYDNLPNNIGFFWNCRHPQICRIDDAHPDTSGLVPGN